MLRKKYIFIAKIIVCFVCITGCTTFQRPTEVWHCEELGLTIDFDQYIDAYLFGGQLNQDGETQEVVCSVFLTGKVGVYDPQEIPLNQSSEPILEGTIQGRGNKKRKFWLKDSEKVYWFYHIEE